MANHDDPSSLRVVDRRWWARGETDEAAEEAGVRKPTYVEDLEQRLADQAAQLQAALADRRRIAEEFDAVRQRLRRDASREVEQSRRAVLAELLEVVDNLDRAIAAARGSAASAGSVVTGVEHVRDQFLAKLASFGATRFVAQGQPFDAGRHEAVAAVPVDDPALDETVVSVVTEGYTIGDDLLRSARVVVGKL